MPHMAQTDTGLRCVRGGLGIIMFPHMPPCPGKPHVSEPLSLEIDCSNSATPTYVDGCACGHSEGLDG